MKGEVFANVGRPQNLEDLKDPRGSFDGLTGGSSGETVYHYHSTELPPFFLGCYGTPPCPLTPVMHPTPFTRPNPLMRPILVGGRP